MKVDLIVLAFIIRNLKLGSRAVQAFCERHSYRSLLMDCDSTSSKKATICIGKLGYSIGQSVSDHIKGSKMRL